ncbi:MAG TPA: hypothetical protein VHX65_03980 [Pirellulales bacterium]|nr:hypothetical protein [Pirellulales bacterium]
MNDSSAGEESGLSAEMQVLAAHLRGEADSLAERYAPAISSTPDATVKGSPARDRRLMRRWLWQSTAVGVAGLALLVWQVERRHESSRSTAPSITTAPITASATVDLKRSPSSHEASAPPVPPAMVATHGSPKNASEPDPAAIRHTQGVAEVGIEPVAVERHPPVDQIEMLRLQVSGFEKVIHKLQAELMARDATEIESQRRIQSLQEEVASLRKQLGDKQPGETQIGDKR